MPQVPDRLPGARTAARRPPPRRPAKPPAARGTATKPAAVRKAPAPANAFSFVEEDRRESADGDHGERGGGFLILAVVCFVVLLLGAGGGGYAALYFTGALSARSAVPAASTPNVPPKPPDDPKPSDDPKIMASRAPCSAAGKLQGADPTLFTEFHDDGTLVTGGAGQEMKGAWKLVDDATVEVTLDVPGKAPLKRRLKFQAGKGQLTLTDEQNQADVFLRPGAKPTAP